LNDIFKLNKVPEQNEQAACVNEMFRLLLTLLHDDHSDYIRCATPQACSDISNEQWTNCRYAMADLVIGSLFKQEFINSPITQIKPELIRESHCASAIPW